MTNEIEDAIVAAARSKGYSINSTTMMTVACDLAGGTLNGDQITIRGKGTLAVRDYLRDLQDRAPSGFSRLQQPDKPADERTVSQMRRRRPAITANDINRYTGVTRAHMTELAASRSAKR
ncbi:hypothetical protein ABIB06_000497 [Bradyrhizobium sp. LB8.2]|uniref:hypothetical protein n=1 Tax=Bradyrhizobium sp. LB8.2 TaxID=3156330 RepID=UPI0033927A62